MAKATTPKDQKFDKQDFDMFEALAALDDKDYGYYDRLTVEQQKKFVPYMLLIWMSCVKGDTDLQNYYLQSVDFHANKYMFNEYVGRHPKLQWLLCTTVSPGLGVQKHWFPKSSGRTKQSKALKFLRSIHPADKLCDLEILAQLNDQQYFENLAREYGWSDKEIRDFFS